MKIYLNIPSTEQAIGETPATVFFGMESSDRLSAEDCLRELHPTAEVINPQYASVVMRVIDDLMERRCNRW